MLALLRAGAESLRLFPLRGTPLATRPGLRVLRVPVSGEVYLLRYLPTAAGVVVVQVKHSREKG
jgi:plasmid stabilization system protein ParE